MTKQQQQQLIAAYTAALAQRDEWWRPVIRTSR